MYKLCINYVWLYVHCTQWNIPSSMKVWLHQSDAATPGQKPNETQIRELLTLLKKASSAELGMGGILTDLESGNEKHFCLLKVVDRPGLVFFFRKGHWNWSEDPIFPCDIGLTWKWIAVLSIPQKLSMDVQSTWWFAPAFRDGSDSAATETSAVRIPYRDGVFCVYGCPCTFKCNVNQSDCSISNLYNIL